MVHGENRIPYWIDRRLTGLAGPEYDAIISFEPPFESEDSQYGEYLLRHVPESEMENYCSSAGALAFVHPGELMDDEHFSARRFYYMYPFDESAKEWTTDRNMVGGMNDIFVQAIMVHEFGHVGGLGHSNRDDALMRDGYNYSILDLIDYDGDAMRELYRGHTSH